MSLGEKDQRVLQELLKVLPSVCLPEQCVESFDATASVRPRIEAMPRQAQLGGFLLVPKRAVIHNIGRPVAGRSGQQQATIKQNFTQRFQVMLINSLPRLATVVGDLTGELQVAVAPLLSYLTPILIRLS